MICLELCVRPFLFPPWTVHLTLEFAAGLESVAFKDGGTSEWNLDRSALALGGEDNGLFCIKFGEFTGIHPRSSACLPQVNGHDTLDVFEIWDIDGLHDEKGRLDDEQ